LRLAGRDYANEGAYFVTICTFRRQLSLQDSAIAEIVEWAWTSIPEHFPSVDLDAFVVMPNHIHGIVVLGARHVGTRHGGHLEDGRSPSLSMIMNKFKGAVTREVRIRDLWDGTPFWQPNYYDHVIRAGELDRIRTYIANNPVAWKYDWENPNRIDNSAHRQRWHWLEDLAPFRM
jgi:REP element-mobilizing transposase RayT